MPEGSKSEIKPTTPDFSTGADLQKLDTTVAFAKYLSEHPNDKEFEGLTDDQLRLLRSHIQQAGPAQADRVASLTSANPTEKVVESKPTWQQKLKGLFGRK